MEREGLDWIGLVLAWDAWIGWYRYFIIGTKVGR